MFHIIKSTRLYYNRAYKGPSSNNHSLDFDTLDDAILATKLLNKINGVGWQIYDTTTGEFVFGPNLEGYER